MFFSNGATKCQKIVASLFSLMVMGLISPIFFHDFVPEITTSISALRISTFLTLGSFIFIFYLRKRGSWEPAPAWREYSTATKLIALAFSPFIIFLFFWVNLAISLPHLYTFAFGQEFSRQDIVIKERIHSRRSCDYRLKPRSTDFTFFHFCISKSSYDRLPNEAVDGTIIGRKSRFGYTIEKIRFGNKVSRS